MASILRALQESVAARLLAMPEFANIPVVPESVKDLETEVQTAVNKMGLCVTVFTSKALRALPGPHQPYFEKIDVLVTVFENVPINRRPQNIGYVTGQEVAELCACYLHCWKPDEVNESFTVFDVVLGQLPRDVAEMGIVSWNVPVSTQGGFAQTIPQVAPVVVDASNPSITATTTTEGAAIFYTLDGSFPAPRNPNAILYTGPFTTDVGTVIKAGAWLAGYLFSGVTTVTAGTQGEWTYLGQGVRYRAQDIQLGAVNTGEFYAVSCASPQGFATLMVGDGTSDAGGWPISNPIYFGQRIRVNTAGIQMWSDDTTLWHPLMAIPLFGGITLGLDAGVTGASGTPSGSETNWGTTAKVTDAGLCLYNADELRWYLLRAAQSFGQTTIQLEAI